MRTTSSSKVLRKALAFAALAGLATCRSPEPEAGATPSPAGILLFLADDHGRDDAGVYGHPSVRTPALDALAGEGLRFTGVRAVTAICQPSRAALLTGLYPESNGVFGFYPLAEGIVPLSAHLADAGYFCGLVGKRHIDPFERYRFHYAPAMPKEEGRDNDRFLADVRGFFDARAANGGAPFFLLVALHDAHRPFPRVGGTGEEAAVPDPIDPPSVPLPAYLPDLPAVREEVAGYLDAVERLDRCVGAIVAELDRRGLGDDTLVLYTSDHGAPFPFAKSTLYEAGLAVPFLARWPGRVRAGATSDALVSLVDVAPTLLELARVPAPDLEGQSFADVLLDRADAHREHLFATQTDHLRQPSRPIRSVRDAHFHYVLNFATDAELTIESVTTPAWSAMLEAAPGDPRLAAQIAHFLHRPTEELYDLAADPHELADRAADPALERELARLRATLLEDMRALDDPFLFVTPFATDADRARARDGYARWEAIQPLRPY